MPLKEIVAVLLRLTSLVFLLRTIPNVIMALGLVGHVVREPRDWWVIVPGIVSLAFGIILWTLAAPIARLVTLGSQTVVPVSGLTRYDVYCTGFVLLGLYHSLTSLAVIVNELQFHFVSAPKASSAAASHDGGLMEVSAAFVHFLVGLGTMLPAALWSRKLLRLEHRLDPPPAASALPAENPSTSHGE